MSSFSTQISTYANGSNVLVAEPVRDGCTSLQAAPELSARNVECLHTLGDLVYGLILVRGREVRHLLERHHLDVQLLVVLHDKVLCVIRTIEVLPLRVLARAGMVASDDEVRRAEVLADDSMPDRLAGPGHAHREREEGEVAHAVRVFGHDRLVDAHAGVVVDVARLGEADDGVDEDVRLPLARGADGQLAVRAMHGVARLEGDDLAPCELLEVRAEFGGSEAQSDIVKVCRRLDGLDLSADVILLDLATEVCDGRVGGVVRTKDLYGLVHLVGAVDILDYAPVSYRRSEV